nr:MAG TPA: C2H2 type zinc-finger protein [Caudoviricetes sp.]
MANYKPKRCAECGMEYTPRSGNSKYCTTECYKVRKNLTDDSEKPAQHTIGTGSALAPKSKRLAPKLHGRHGMRRIRIAS